MITLSRSYRRKRFIGISLILICLVLYYINQSSLIPNVPQQEEVIDDGFDDDEIKPKKMPKLTDEHFEKIEDELFDKDELAIGRDTFRDIKHSQGFTKHVEDDNDLLLDPQYSHLPLLYNRLRLGKISPNYVKKGETFKITKDYNMQNPINKLRNLYNTKKNFPQIQSQRLAGQDTRLQLVRGLFIENWNQYFYFSKKFDSFKPLSLSGEDDYIGWSLTLIDSLDTLFLMGYQEEFDMALNYIDKINFHEVKRDDLPVFETNIRILGGLLSAFDLSEEYTLLDKARTVADILLRSFDTLNHLPMMYYNLRHSQRQRQVYPSMSNYLSEVGSLSLEFTRLSIMTRDMKYFTYVMNLIDKIIESKDEFLIKGLIPNEVDLSGCESIFREEDIMGKYGGKVPENAKQMILMYDFNDDNELVYCIPSDKMKIKPTNSESQVFSLEGKSDSFYEYLLKLYILLNGNVDDQYTQFFVKAKDKIKKFLIFKPKLNEKDLLFLNEITVTLDGDQLDIVQHNKVSHLSCFAGGFFTMVNRVFLEQEDLEIGKQLTRSCIKISEKCGLFPESFLVDSCDDLLECEYDELERLKFILSLTGKSKYKEPKRVDVDIVDGPLKYHLHTSSVVPFTPYDAKLERWQTGDAWNQPLEFNSMDPRHLLRPELIESLFINWRVTGLELYREQAWELFEKIGQYTGKEVSHGKETEFVQATIRDITSDDKTYTDELESWWFAETLKYFYLIFQDTKVLSLDEWVFNTEGHPFRKEKFWLSNRDL